MNGAFLYLTFCSIKNRVRVRLKRLREPRYLIGSVVGVGYFYFMFFRPRGRGGPPPGVLGFASEIRGTLELGGALLLLLIAALAWAWPQSGTPGLVFSRADVQFLFPAPLTRQQLIRYKIVRSVTGSLMGSLFMTILFRPGSLASGWMFFFGLSSAMTIVTLHLTGVSLRRASLAQHGASGWRRQGLPLAVVAGALVALGWSLAANWAALDAADGPREALRALDRVSSSGAAAIILWPFRAIVRLPLAVSPVAFLRALPAVVALMALNYVWVMRSDASFEEASAELAEKVAQTRKGAQRAPAKVRAMSTPFALAPSGPPELALLWKNLILLGRYASLKTLLRLLPIVVIFGFAFSRGSGRAGLADMVTIVCLMFGAFATLLGPQIARNDLRQDFAHLAVLKAWPIRGAALVRGEVLAPALVLTGVIWLFIVAAFSFSLNARVLASVPIATRLSYTVAAMLLAPALALTQLVLQNGLVVLFPAWMTTSGAKSAGVDVMGQRLLMTYGMLLVLVVAVLPAALVAGLVGAGIYLVTRTIPILVPSVVTVVAIVAECFLATEAIGRLLDRTDVAAIDAPE